MSVPTGSVELPGSQGGRLPRRALVISAKIGAGHNTAAYGVEQTARRLWPGCGLRRIDVLDAMSMGAGGLLRWLYVFNVQLTPWLYEFFYGALWTYRWAARGSKRLVGSWSGRRLAACIAEYDPDLIVSTHPIASAGLDWLRRHRGLDVPVAVWVLDFATHPFWLYRDLDLHVVMHEVCAEAARAAEPGISLRVGAPSIPDAFRPGDRMAARRKVGLRTDSFVALVSCGYFGFGTVERAVDALLDVDPRVQVVAVCGRNERLYRRLAARGLPVGRLHLLGWVDDMASYTVAADVVVTNAGGATAMEALCCGRALVLFEPIAAHGRANADSMARPGLATLSGNRADLTRVVRQLLKDPRQRAHHEARALAFAQRRSRANDLRALLPLLAGRPRQRGPLRLRARRLRPRRNRQRSRRTSPRRGRPRREAVRPEDAFFFYTQTRTVAQQVGGIAVLDHSTLAFPQVCAEVERRLPGLPNLRRRLEPPIRWWRRPSWVLEDALDVTDHLKERVIGADGQPGTFAELVDDFFSSPVSLERAPWEMHFVRGLDDGGSALVVKLHHAMGDGFAAIDALSGLLEDTRRSTETAATAAQPKDQGVLAKNEGTTKAGRLTQVRGRTRGAGLVLGGLWNLGRAGRAPRCSLNGQLRTPQRHLVSLSLPASDVRGAARGLEATTSELVLTVVADALHRLLAARGESPQSLMVMVPRTMRTKKSRTAPGNWTGGARVAVPAGEMSPLSRLREIQRMLRRSLRYGEPEASRFLMRAMASLPGPVEARVARWTYRGHWFNLIVSIIPGPRRPFSFAGVRLQEVYPVLPLADGVGLAIGVLSWGDSITLGMTTDVTLVSDADCLVDEVRASFFTLQGVVAR